MFSEIVTSINDFGKTKLAPSKVCDGVGVFAITEILRNFILFQDVSADTTHIPFTKIHDDAVKKYLASTCISDSVGIYLSRTYNNINMSYYVNHSETPNIHYDWDLDEFVTLRDILTGEELTCLYDKKEIDWLT
jgi:hypothetical protein